MAAVKNFLKKEIVLTVSALLAVLSCFFVHPDAQYISYIDFRTLSILLSLMLTMAGLRNIDVFRQIGENLAARTGTTRGLSLILVAMCFVFSMFITNDVALLTFVPFTVVTLEAAKQEKLLIPVIVFETIAANLGSMTMPIGNPQNLYLYSLAGLGIGAFLRLMLPYSVLAAVLIALFLCMQVKAEKITAVRIGTYERTGRQKLLIAVYVITFAVSLLVVARVLDYRIGLAVVVLLVLIFDFKRLAKPDYSLILTFIFLFIFIGNLKRIQALSSILQALIAKEEVTVSIVLSQIISNVPAAILCSGFTDNYKALIVGTNLGGLGTLIASMASLISFKQYAAVEGGNKGKYIRDFTVWNLVLLACMYALYLVLKLL